MTLLQTSLPSLSILGWLPVIMVVILIHELGHFWVARWCGVNIATFSIGFGPELFHWHDRHGTRWRLAALPLGGYVKFAGDENVASFPSEEAIAKMTPEERAGAFPLKPLWQRAAVVLAGPVANFLSAILLFAVVSSAQGIPVPSQAKVTVIPDSPAARSGLQTGDVIVKINDWSVRHFGDVQRFMIVQPVDRDSQLGIERDGKAMTLLFRPERRLLENGMGGKNWRRVLGVRPHPDTFKIERSQPGVLGSLAYGVNISLQIIGDTVFVLTHPLAFIENAVGLPSMINGSNQVVNHSIQESTILPTLAFIAVLSVSIGFFNLLPIPVLDGGHLMFYAAEWLRGRPLSEGVHEFALRVGLAAIASLFMVVLWNERYNICGWFSGLGVSCTGLG